jgi:hypothetical protein
VAVLRVMQVWYCCVLPCVAVLRVMQVRGPAVYPDVHPMQRHACLGCCAAQPPLAPPTICSMSSRVNSSAAMRTRDLGCSTRAVPHGWLLSSLAYLTCRVAGGREVEQGCAAA